jgi:uncharacterized phage protein (TIGR01671 family)
MKIIRGQRPQRERIHDMGREIKFRAWDTETKEMSYDFLNKHWLRVCIESPYVELMQYTGLKDKDGREIFEGDIVGVNAYLGHGYGRKVVFRNGCFGFEAVPNVSEEICYLEVWTENVEIIGNEFENPELLEV